MSRTAPTRGKHVLVLGGQGVLGSIAAKTFRDAGWAVVRAGRRPAPGNDFRLVDLAERTTLAPALDAADLVVNTVPDPQLAAENMVLDRGGLLVNVSALPAAATQRLRDGRAAPRGTVVMNAGIAPGVTNLVAAGLLAEHPEADQVDVVFTVSGRSSVGRAGAEFAHRGLTSQRHHRTKMVPLPAPFGRRRCLGFAETDRGWLSSNVVGARRVDTYVCLGEVARHCGLLALNAARLVSHIPRAAFVTGVTQPTCEPVAHRIAVLRAGRELAARTIRCSGDYRAAAASALVLASALRARGANLPLGLVVPEEALTLGDLHRGLHDAGIDIVDEERPRTATSGSRTPAPGRRAGAR